MGKEDQGSDITRAIDTVVVVSPEEYKIVDEFLKFLRGRVRGTFLVEVVTHMKRRFVKYEITDKYTNDLNYITENEN